MCKRLKDLISMFQRDFFFLVFSSSSARSSSILHSTQSPSLELFATSISSHSLFHSRCCTRNIAIDFNSFLRCVSRARAKLPWKIKRARFPSHDFVRLLLEATSGFFFSSLFIRHFNSPSSVNWLLKSFATQVNSSKRLSESRAWLLLACFSRFFN